jgi:formate/nitrite transporter FocA (FNT family)
LVKERPSRPEPAGKRQAREERQVEERSELRTPVVYEIVRKRGDEEMARPFTSLWWSGVAAGMSMSFSLLTQAILLTNLPDAPWRHLATSAGYPVGFLMVILARQQLFTENTITAVLPVMKHFTLHNVARLARMWSIVFVANMVGTLFAAYFCTLTPVISPELRDAMLSVSADAMRNGAVDTFFRAISAGFLIATTVWLIPGARRARDQVKAGASRRQRRPLQSKNRPAGRARAVAGPRCPRESNRCRNYADTCRNYTRLQRDGSCDACAVLACMRPRACHGMADARHATVVIARATARTPRARRFQQENEPAVAVSWPRALRRIVAHAAGL